MTLHYGTLEMQPFPMGSCCHGPLSPNSVDMTLLLMWPFVVGSCRQHRDIGSLVQPLGQLIMGLTSCT